MPEPLKRRSVIDGMKIEAKKKSQKKAAAMTSGPKRCGPGQVKREAYIRHSYKKSSGARVKAAAVPSTCIAATGRAKTTHHKGQQLFVLKKDVLKEYGYHDVRHMSAQARHTALNRALADKIKPLVLYRMINALYTLNENKDKPLAAIFDADKVYIKSTPAYQNR